MHFDTWYTFSPQKWITALCSSLVEIKLGVTKKKKKTKLDRNELSRSHLHHDGRKEVDHMCFVMDRLCGLVVRVSDYRYRGTGFDSRRYQIF
jgi:hypothetical protein